MPTVVRMHLRHLSPVVTEPCKASHKLRVVCPVQQFNDLSIYDLQGFGQRVTMVRIGFDRFSCHVRCNL